MLLIHCTSPTLEKYIFRAILNFLALENEFYSSLSYYDLLGISFHPCPLMFTEDPLHSGCPLPCGYHQLPAGGAGCKVFPASQVAVHGIG